MLMDCSACWKAAGLKLPAASLKCRIFHDLAKQRGVADAKLKHAGVSIDGGAADQPLQHPVVEAERARLLDAEAAPGLRAHGPEHVLLGAHIVLLADFDVADGDNVLRAITLEPSGGNQMMKLAISRRIKTTPMTPPAPLRKVSSATPLEPSIR